MGILDKIHGQNISKAFDKLNSFLIEKSPTKNKGLYDGLVVVPVKFLSTILRGLTAPIEQIASSAIHLVAAVFSQDHKGELIKARDFIFIEFPLGTLASIFSIAIAPLNIIIDEVKVAKDPVKFEDESKRLDKEESKQKLVALLDEITDNEDEIRAKDILDKIDNNIPLNIKDSLSLIRLIFKYDKELNKAREKFEQARAEFRKTREEFWESMNEEEVPKSQQNIPESEQNIPESEQNINDLDSFATYVRKYALKNKIKISQDHLNVLENKNSSTEDKKKAVDRIRVKVLFFLHPDKTAGLDEEEKNKRNAEYTKINNAWDKINKP